MQTLPIIIVLAAAVYTMLVAVVLSGLKSFLGWGLQLSAAAA